MSKIYYPYRIKTKEELITEYGEDWITCVSINVGWVDDMYNILGKDYPHEDFILNECEDDTYLTMNDDERNYSWTITRRFLIKKKLHMIPNYKPKKFIREI
jgi:hypothetical protein